MAVWVPCWKNTCFLFLVSFTQFLFHSATLWYAGRKTQHGYKQHSVLEGIYLATCTGRSCQRWRTSGVAFPFSSYHGTWQWSSLYRWEGDGRGWWPHRTGRSRSVGGKKMWKMVKPCVTEVHNSIRCLAPSVRWSEFQQRNYSFLLGLSLYC